MTVVDLFAGPGGFDLAARELDLDVLGIEFDATVCETRKAAGLRTLHADVSELDPADHRGAVGLIASPTCQPWSSAGSRKGQRDKKLVYECLTDLAQGRDTRADHLPRCEDARSLLVCEPLRWALALEPKWMAWEQVPPVLELWRWHVPVLRWLGYQVWTGILKAERYGVPQTRKRAFLLAHRERFPHPPAPTHQEYVPGEPAAAQLTFEGELLPWVSMAEALGWEGVDRPAPTVTGGGGETGGGPEPFGNHSRKALMGFPRKADELGPATEDGYRERDLRPTDLPAQNVTEKARAWTLRPAGGKRPNAVKRRADEPAQTVLAGNDAATMAWIDTGRDDGNQTRDVDQPAPTVTGARSQLQFKAAGDPLGLKGEDWPERRPATTTVGESRVFQPGGHHGEGQQSQNAVRVTEAEAGLLQGFPADYPFAGSRTARFTQIGNAVPPPLAKAVLEALL